MAYNATIVTEYGSVFVGEVKDGKILSSNAVQCTGMEGREEYDTYIRKVKKVTCVIVDGCAGYKRVLRGLMLPTAYQV